MSSIQHYMSIPSVKLTWRPYYECNHKKNKSSEDMIGLLLGTAHYPHCTLFQSTRKIKFGTPQQASTKASSFGKRKVLSSPPFTPKPLEQAHFPIGNPSGDPRWNLSTGRGGQEVLIALSANICPKTWKKGRGVLQKVPKKKVVLAQRQQPAEVSGVLGKFSGEWRIPPLVRPAFQTVSSNSHLWLWSASMEQ